MGASTRSRTTTKARKPRVSAKVSQREAVRRYRMNMRRQGMRLLQIWVPDTAAPGFDEECRRQSRLVSENPGPDERAMNRELDAWTGEIDKQMGKYR